MPRTRKPKPTDVPEDVLDHFAGHARPMSPPDVDAVMRRFEKALVERMLGGELTHHLGYPPGGTRPGDTTNQRNGTSSKTVLTEEGRSISPFPATAIGRCDLKARGCRDILIAATDGLKGMGEALAAVFPETTL